MSELLSHVKTQKMEGMGTVQTEQASCWGCCYKELGKTHRSRPYPCLHSLARPIHFVQISLGSVLSLDHQQICQAMDQMGWYSRGCLNIFSINVGDDGFTLLCGLHPCKANPSASLAGVSKGSSGDNLARGLQHSLQFFLSIDSGRFDMYTFVGSCSCCFAICACTPLAFSTVTVFCAAEGWSKSTTKPELLNPFVVLSAWPYGRQSCHMTDTT